MVFNWIARLPGYHYYDSPEGQDCLDKTIFLSKVGLICGVSAATIDVITMSKPVGFQNIAGRYVQLSFPLMAVCSSFAAVSCLSTSIRGKDDTFNYTLGGFVAGLVAGAACKSGTGGTVASVLFALGGYCTKNAEENGIKLWKDGPQRQGFGGIWSIKLDWSLTEERPRGWKKSENE